MPSPPAPSARCARSCRSPLPWCATAASSILLKGASAANEIEAAEKQLRKFRVTNARVEVVGEGLLDEPTRVVRGDRPLTESRRVA